MRRPRIFLPCSHARRLVYARALMLLLPQPPPLGPQAAYSFLGLLHVRRTTVDARPPTATALLLLLFIFSSVGTILVGAASSSSTRSPLPLTRSTAARPPDRCRWRTLAVVPLQAEAGASAAHAPLRVGVCVHAVSRELVCVQHV